MKKKRRRAVCRCLTVTIGVIAFPFEGVGYLCDLVSEKLHDCSDWLEDKLRVYDYDPD